MPQIADVMWQAAEQEDKVPTSAEQWVWSWWLGRQFGFGLAYGSAWRVG